MTEAVGDSLLLALGLFRAPSHRNAARERPLPSDIADVVYLATGARNAVREATRVTGETETVVVEAARFYLQQVLFSPDADAYRVLGVEPDAPLSRIREHHRWLQRWLHPDRRNGAWEAIFASRVNAAWAQLRTTEARRVYDASRISNGIFTPRSNASVGGRIWIPDVERPGPNGLRLLAMAALSGCMVLGVLLIRKEDRPPDWDGFPSSAATEAKASDAKGSFASPAVTAEKPPSSRPIHPLNDPVVIVGRDSLVRDQPPRDQVRTTSEPVPVLASEPAPSIRVLAPLRVDAVISQPPASAAEQLAARPAPGLMRGIQGSAVVVLENPVSPELVDASPANRSGPLGSTAPSVGEAPELADPLKRMQLARDCTGQVVRYLGDPSVRVPPVWNDVPSQLRAESFQRALQARLRTAGKITIELKDPQWRIGDRHSSLLATYRAVGRHGVAETGLLTLDMTWRERTWLVREISLGPSS